MTPCRPTVLAVLVLAVGIGVVELGLRDAAPPGVAVGVPTPARGVVERLRSIPLIEVADPRAAAVASGVVFGRAEQLSATDEQAFLASGLRHLLR